MKSQIETRLEWGIEAARAGEYERAREILIHVIELDQYNEQAWLWLGSVVETTADQIVCLENVLFVNPHNAQASVELERLRRQPHAFATRPTFPRLDLSQALEWEEEDEAEEEEKERRKRKAAAAPPLPVGKVCPHCGFRNPGWGYLCDRCGADLRPVDVREALGMASWGRTLTTLAVTILSIPMWRVIVGVVSGLLLGESEPGRSLVAMALRCAVETLWPDLALVLIGLPIVLLTWAGARLVGGKQDLKTHVQLTLVAYLSWMILIGLLSPLTPAISRLLGSEKYFDRIQIFISAVAGLMGLLWLTQAVRAAHRLPAMRAILVVVLIAVLTVALLFSLDLFTSLMDTLKILFLPCPG